MRQIRERLKDVLVTAAGNISRGTVARPPPTPTTLLPPLPNGKGGYVVPRSLLPSCLIQLNSDGRQAKAEPGRRRSRTPGATHTTRPRVASLTGKPKKGHGKKGKERVGSLHRHKVAPTLLLVCCREVTEKEGSAGGGGTRGESESTEQH